MQTTDFFIKLKLFFFFLILLPATVVLYCIRLPTASTAGTLLQSLIARAADENCYVVMASLDLSMAFDMVNTELLIKRLRIMDMPVDLINLIREWLTGRSFYVQVGDDCSTEG